MECGLVNSGLHCIWFKMDESYSINIEQQAVVEILENKYKIPIRIH